MFGNAIYRADHFAYHFQITDTRPIGHKAFGFPKSEWRWIRKYMHTQCKLDTMRKLCPGWDEDPLFIQGVVLVKGGNLSRITGLL